MRHLQSDRLIIRPCSPDDRYDFIDLERDPEVMRYLNGGYAVNKEQGNPDSSFLMPRGTEDYVWTACRRESHAFVGWFCLWPDGDRVAELGYRLRRDCWGQGLATEGARTIIDWGFESGAYDRIFATTLAVNLGSRKVMEKIGLTYTRTVFPDGADMFPGTEQGEVIYEISR
jgi:RimJ/RimL family protein N-acetyltransferase